MSDGPVRLLDARSKSSAQMRLLIRAARADVPPEKRVRDLGARIGIGALAGAAKGASSAALALSVAKLCVVALVGAAVMATAVAGRDADVSVVLPAATPRARATAAPPHGAPHVIPSAAQPREEPQARPVGSFAPQGGAPDDVRSDADSPSEGALLSEAQRALRSNPGRALALADRDARLHPTGLLAQEREVIAIEALAELGRRGEARGRAAAFLRVWPSSAHRARIEQLVGPI